MNNKNIKYLLFILTFLIVFMLVNYFKEPFVNKYKIKVSSPNDVFYAGAYYRAIDINNNTIEDDSIKFVQNKMEYKFRDWNVKKDGNKNIITFICDINGFIEFNSTRQEQWFYTFMHHIPFIFDANTGEIYNSTKVSVDNSVDIILNELSKDIDTKYTEIKWNGRTRKIGVISEDYFKGWENPIETKVSDKACNEYAKIPVSMTATYTVEAPLNYDGMMIAIKKSGATKEVFNKEINDRNEYIELKEEEEKTGIKSDRLKEIEKETITIHKLIDPNDKTRKDAKAEDYDYVRISDAVNINGTIKLIRIIYIIVSFLILASTLSIGLNKKKRKTKKKKTNKK